MKLADFPLLHTDVMVVALEGTNTTAWHLNTEVQFWSDAGRCWLAQGGAPVAVDPRSAGLAARLERKDLPWLLRKVQGDLVYLQCAEPADVLWLDAPMELGVGEHIAEQLSREGKIDRADVALAVGWCTATFLIEGQRQRLAAVRYDSIVPGEWRVTSGTWRADLERTEDGKVLVRRLTSTPQQLASWTLVEGGIRFVDVSVATQLMSESQQALLRQAVQTHGDYVDLWKKYSDREWQRSLRQAAGLGVLPYQKCEDASDEGGVVRFIVEPGPLAIFKKAWLALESDGALALEAHAHQPDWHASHYQDMASADNQRRLRGRPRFERNAVVIDSDKAAPAEGFLFLSLTGDRTVQERRQKAMQNISTQARSVKLRYILQGVNVPASRTTRHDPMTAATRACFRHGRATQSQEAAIKMALETQDIALIIGPPGTGKTQVIAALSRRLAEIGSEGGAEHQVLIASFQHDAVENALDRTRVFDLPAIKVGSNRHAGRADPVQHWCTQKHAELDKALGEREALEPHVGLLNRLHRNMATLRHSQLDLEERHTLLRDAAQCLRELAQAHRIRLPASLQAAWSEYIALVPVTARPAGSVKLRTRALRAMRALRVTQAGFADDGPARAAEGHALLAASDAAVAPEDVLALGAFAGMLSLDSVTADQAAALRARLVDRLLANYRPAAILHQLDAEGQRLLSAIEDALAEKLKGSRLGVSSVLARYRDAFVNHPVRTREAVRTYAMVVGATCQQSAGMEMASLKSLGGIGDAGIVFDTVIIDEAARANPLDLFIPMSMAGTRVILVGDHRQLPHLLEPELEDEVTQEHDLNATQRLAFKDSLFERLWRQLKDRSDQDNFPRVVMLDTQFRMHPLLGQLVSEQFYEKEGLPPLKPGRTASAFHSNIPGYEGKVCGWLNVPLNAGPEGRRGNSPMRTAEVQRIAIEIKRLLEQGAASLSIGVITFYSAQRDAIFEELGQIGITERDTDTGAWGVSAPWNGVTTGGEEKLRIGTVDAFQGKEFDVVLLSIVRANASLLPGGANAEGYEKAANGKFGHLRLSNRMNVAMSRQRSLLVAVGDRAMAAGADNAGAVPALAAFLALCEGGYGVVR